MQPAWNPRNFDPLKDEHPVSWLMQNLKPELYEPVTQWLDEVMGCETRRPEALVMPDMGWQIKTLETKFGLTTLFMP